MPWEIERINTIGAKPIIRIQMPYEYLEILISSDLWDQLQKYVHEANRRENPMSFREAIDMINEIKGVKPETDFIAADEEIKGKISGTVGEAFAREADVDELACFCAMRHINALQRQSCYKRTANWLEPCQGCPKYENDECNVDWLWNIMPIAKMGKLNPTLTPMKDKEETTDGRKSI